MLTLVEKILFIAAAALSVGLTLRSAERIRRVIRRGSGRFSLRGVLGRLIPTFVNTVFQRITFKTRLGPGAAHLVVVWGFTYYLLVNVGDVLQGLLPGFVFMGRAWVGGAYHLGADLLSVAILIGTGTLVIRRLLFGPRIFGFLESTPVEAQVRPGVFRDSMIVASFILLHVGWRFLGESFTLAHEGPDPWQPLASQVSRLWSWASPASLEVMVHVSFWLAIGLVLLFLPYFARSKHIHIFFAPLNFLLKPVAVSRVGSEPRPHWEKIALLGPIDFEDESLTQYGAQRVEQLPWPQVMDAYACIMCNRCQDVCPAHLTGKALSPSALEINKRYFINENAADLAAGKESPKTLLEFAVSEEALWACTTCNACVEICPVGNQPMLDLLQMRRHQVLMENAFPEQLQVAFRGMERQGNPWGLAPEHRLDWGRDLDLPTVATHPRAEILWWVGCAPATDARAQKVARDFVRILRAAGVDFAVLGERERCTGDSARRAGNEYLFSQLAQVNVQTLNAVQPRRIVTTCPHCMNTLANEYPAFGGSYAVIHHTQLINELVGAGRLTLEPQAMEAVAFHDPCYLGRHNGVFEAPRGALRQAGAQLRELPRSRSNSFCCGAGGAQMWKEEEHGSERVNNTRYAEVRASGAKTLAVGCPFCMVMLSDAARAAGDPVPVRDVAEVVAAALPK
jgi:Fe-S oxidoreductase